MKLRSMVLLAAAFAGAAFAVRAALAPQAHNALGPLYPVAEESLLAALKSAAAGYESSGQAAADRIVRRKKAAAYIKGPPVRIPVRRAAVYTVRLFDPTVTVSPPGRAAARIAVNPLEHGGLRARLLLFDDRDPQQREFARSQAMQEERIYPVLVAGSPAAFAQATGLRAYFDQDGVISRRLQIEAYPALVSAQGRRLRIETGLPAAGR